MGRSLFAGRRPYILHLGTLEPRKGLLTLIKAWDRLQEIMPEAPDLVLAGREGWDQYYGKGRLNISAAFAARTVPSATPMGLAVLLLGMGIAIRRRR